MRGIKDIINEWDMPTISCVIYQSPYRELIDLIQMLPEEKILPTRLFHNQRLKTFLQELYYHFTIEEIDGVLCEIIRQGGKYPIEGDVVSYLNILY